jgi:hypothetical protein
LTVGTLGARQEGDRDLNTRESPDDAFKGKSTSDVVLSAETITGYLPDIENIEGSASGRAENGIVVDGRVTDKSRPQVQGGVSAVGPVPVVNTENGGLKS